MTSWYARVNILDSNTCGGAEMLYRMESTLTEQIAKFKAWIGPYFNQGKQLDTTQCCSFRLSGTVMTLLQVRQTADITEIVAHDSVSYDSLENLPLILQSWVEKYDLKTIPCYWLLEPHDYQLFMIESLPVHETELRSALNWRIRSLISYPIEDASIDYFTLPPKKNSPDLPLVAAITANITHLLTTMNIFKKAGMELQSIYIPELALRNIASLHEVDEKSTAILYFFANTIILTISRNKILYFTRQLHWQQNSTSEADFSELSLEILRYFDYYQSQWRHPIPSRIYLASDLPEKESLISQLSSNLQTPVQPYTLPGVLLNPENRLLVQSGYLLNYGCAIQKDTPYA